MGLRSNGDVLIGRQQATVSSARRRRRVNWPMLAMVLPVLAWMMFSFGAPQLFMLFISFMSQGEYGGVVYHFTLGNYAQLASPLYLQVIYHSLRFSAGVTVLCLVVGYPFAYAMATSSPKRRLLLLFLVIIPFWTSQLIRTFAMMFIINTDGVLNTLLLHLHLITQPLQLLYTPFAVYLGQFYSMLPYMILPLYASIQTFMGQPEMMEAAYDLGANDFQTFLKVTFPLTSSGIAVGSLLVFIPSIASYFIPLLMGGGGSEMVGNYIGSQFLAADNWPYGAAMSIGVIFVSLVLISVLFRFMKNTFLEEA